MDPATTGPTTSRASTASGATVMTTSPSREARSSLLGVRLEGVHLVGLAVGLQTEGRGAAEDLPLEDGGRQDAALDAAVAERGDELLARELARHLLDGGLQALHG